MFCNNLLKLLSKSIECIVLQIREDFRSALFNLALLLSEAGRPMEAIPFLHRLLKVSI